MTTTGRPILIDRAGPSGAPAAVLHPDDPLPKTWRVVQEWTYRGGQRGAWLERTDRPSGRNRTPARRAQVVYRTTAKRSPRTSTTGQALGYAERGLVCSVGWQLAYSNDLDYWTPGGLRRQQEADEQARRNYLGLSEAELRERDRAAAKAYATQHKTDRDSGAIRLSEDHGTEAKLEIAPLTVTASPNQKLSAKCGVLWHWHEDWWEDPATGWRGVWAMEEWTGHATAVRVRVMDDWPVVDPSRFREALSAAVYGKRLPTMADEQAMRNQLASAPIGPVEDMGSTVSAQVAAIVGDEQ